MRLPLDSALAANRLRRRLGGAFWALLLLIAAVPAVPAHGEDDPYSATVRVDATAANVAQARDQARVDGQRQALIAVLTRLAGGGVEAGKLPKLDDKAIGAMVASFEVANEHMSAVRYFADYTYHFKPSEVRRVLRTAGLTPGETPAKPTAEAGAKPVVVLPVYVVGNRVALWQEPNRWRQAWAQRPAAPGGGPRLVVPSGDAEDATAIDGERARSGDAAALTAIARKNGAEDVVVAVATARLDGSDLVGADVETKRYHLGQLVDSQSKSLDADADEGRNEFMKRVADATAADIETAIAKNAPGRYDQQGSLVAVIAINSLQDWLGIRDRLAGVSAIRSVELMSLNRQEATVQIAYVGSIDQLKASLAGISLDLVRGDPAWRLARTGAASN